MEIPVIQIQDPRLRQFIPVMFLLGLDKSLMLISVFCTAHLGWNSYKVKLFRQALKILGTTGLFDAFLISITRFEITPTSYLYQGLKFKIPTLERKQVDLFKLNKVNHYKIVLFPDIGNSVLRTICIDFDKKILEKSRSYFFLF